MYAHLSGSAPLGDPNTTGVFIREEDPQTHRKRPLGPRQRFKGCSHKPRMASSYQELEEAGKGPPLAPSCQHSPADTSIFDVGLQSCKGVRFCCLQARVCGSPGKLTSRVTYDLRLRPKSSKHEDHSFIHFFTHGCIKCLLSANYLMVSVLGSRNRGANALPSWSSYPRERRQARHQSGKRWSVSAGHERHPEKRLHQDEGQAPLKRGGTFKGRAEGVGHRLSPRAQPLGSSLPLALRGETCTLGCVFRILAVWPRARY